VPFKPHPTDPDKVVYQSRKYNFETSPRHALQAEYERGFIDGMQKQMQSSVDKAVNAMSEREWVGLTEEDLKLLSAEWRIVYGAWMDDFAKDIEAKLKEKNT
jgi:hypothetical protein